jgi:hypothetical protein
MQHACKYYYATINTYEEGVAIGTAEVTYEPEDYIRKGYCTLFAEY